MVTFHSFSHPPTTEGAMPDRSDLFLSHSLSLTRSLSLSLSLSLFVPSPPQRGDSTIYQSTRHGKWSKKSAKRRGSGTHVASCTKPKKAVGTSNAARHAAIIAGNKHAYAIAASFLPVARFGNPTLLSCAFSDCPPLSLFNFQ